MARPVNDASHTAVSKHYVMEKVVIQPTQTNKADNYRSMESVSFEHIHTGEYLLCGIYTVMCYKIGSYLNI